MIEPEVSSHMHVLVAYGSTRGRTAGLAEMIGDALAADGATAEVHPATARGSLQACDAVIVVGALSAWRWHRDARRFVRRHAAELRDLPVWLVASAPSNRSARTGTLPPVRHVAKLLESIGARGQVTFAGRPQSDATAAAGDRCDPEQVREFAAMVSRSTRGPVDGAIAAMLEHAEHHTDQPPRIDLSSAVGEAAHEIEDLGYEGIPDSGPTLIDAHDDPRPPSPFAGGLSQFPVD